MSIVLSDSSQCNHIKCNHKRYIQEMYTKRDIRYLQENNSDISLFLIENDYNI